MKKKFTLRKHQILRSKKEINLLFEKGQSILHYPLKLVYLSQPFPLQSTDEKNIDKFKVMFIVPKKNIKKSAHRNAIKRKMREGFRLLQHELKMPENTIYWIAFIYISKSKDDGSYDKIFNSIKNIIENIQYCPK